MSSNDQDDELEVDLLVVGGGMAGLTVAGNAASQGATVLVAEVAEQIGGSSAMSEGYIWTASSLEDFLELDPEGDREKFIALREGFEESIEWLRSLDVEVGPSMGILGHGAGHKVDIIGYLERMRRLVERSAGWIMTECDVQGLILEGARVVGARAADNGKTRESTTIKAKATVLATGGFHASRELRERYGLPGAADLLVRGNSANRGGGLELGKAAGGATVAKMTGFYGHPVPYPLPSLEEKDNTILAQYQAAHGILLSRSGKRFCDESEGYSVVAQEIAEIGQALLIIDERIRQEHVLTPVAIGMDAGVDKMEVGAERGANFARASTLVDLARQTESWGYAADEVTRAVEEFNQAVVEQPGVLSPGRRENRQPIAQPPFSALEVQSSITFTYGGLATDIDGRVLTESGAVVPGLFAAGNDASLNVRGYSGSLVRGLVLGRRLAKVAYSAESGH